MKAFRDLNRQDLLGRFLHIVYETKTRKGTSQVTFMMETRERKSWGTEPQEIVTEHRVLCFGDDAERISKYGKAGVTVYISGKHQLRRVNKENEVVTVHETVASIVAIPNRQPRPRREEVDSFEIKEEGQARGGKNEALSRRSIEDYYSDVL